jgi:hypothetical protein
MTQRSGVDALAKPDLAAADEGPPRF